MCGIIRFKVFNVEAQRNAENAKKKVFEPRRSRREFCHSDPRENGGKSLNISREILRFAQNDKCLRESLCPL
jgi:hypothetical protein